MKPTTKQIRKAARDNYLESWQPDLQMSAFEEGVNYAIKQMTDIDTERFIKPTDKQLIDICILFNEGRVNKKKIIDQLSILDFVVDRIYENGDVTKPLKFKQP